MNTQKKLNQLTMKIESLCQPLQSIFAGNDITDWQSCLPLLFEWQSHPLMTGVDDFLAKMYIEVDRRIHTLAPEILGPLEEHVLGIGSVSPIFMHP